MAEYTTAIDAQISQLLRQRGSVTPEMLAGVDVVDGAALLARYVDVHAHEVAFVFDGQRLTWAAAATTAPVTPVAPAAPPAVPQGLGAGGAPPEPPYMPAVSLEGVPRPAVSPVDQILSAPQQGKSLLDFEPSGGPYPKWAWWPPLMFGLLGGLFSWFVVRESNPRAARNMLITGLVVQVVSACIGVVLLGGMQPSLGRVGAAGAGAVWPPSQTASFYYFGTST